MELTALLMKTGLTRHEATLYALLLTTEATSGYEAAKACGISRSNVYHALEALVEKGGAYRIDGEVVRYTAVPVEEYCKNVQRETDATLSQIRRLAPQPIGLPDAYITILGDDKILHKIKNMIEGAEQRLYLSMEEGICRQVEAELFNAVQRGLKVVIVTDPPFALCGAQVYHSRKQRAQVRLITDSQQVLTGSLQTDTEKGACLFTQNQTLVTLFKDALRTEIELIQLKGEETP